MDGRGTVYVESNTSDVILKLGPNATRPTGLAVGDVPRGIAVDTDDNLYVAATGPEGDAVYRFEAGASSPELLPFSGMQWNDAGPVGIALDQAGSVYATDQESDRVVKLPRTGS